MEDKKDVISDIVKRNIISQIEGELRGHRKILPYLSSYESRYINSNHISRKQLFEFDENVTKEDVAEFIQPLLKQLVSKYICELRNFTNTEIDDPVYIDSVSKGIIKSVKDRKRAIIAKEAWDAKMEANRLKQEQDRLKKQALSDKKGLFVNSLTPEQKAIYNETHTEPRPGYSTWLRDVSI